MAGLAAAIRLAIKGFDVTVYEKNSYPGGKLSWFEQDGYGFDAGPSLFTQPHLLEELFTAASEPAEAYFSYKRLATTCNYFFENGRQLTAVADADQFACDMHEQLGEPAINVKTYLEKASAAYKDIGKIFMEHSLHHYKNIAFTGVFSALKTLRFDYLFRSLNVYNSKAFKTPEAVQLFNRFATYNGSNPYKAPAMLSLIAHLELNEGVYYPRGGMISITNALYRLAIKKEVKFFFNTPVDRIVHSGGKATGIIAGKRTMHADIVVSNCDVYFTYKHLLNDGNTAKKLLKQERSSSALVFYWGINGSFAQLGLHNIFFSADYKTEFDHLFAGKDLYNDPTVYINITSKMEEGHAPAGKENWFVMINAPANTGQNWDELKAGARQNILGKLNRLLQTDIEPLIETEAVLDPVSIEARTASFMGSIYGTGSNSKMAAFARHPNFSKDIEGLYFVGGSVHPGGGIPLCLHSAKIMSDLV